MRPESDRPLKIKVLAAALTASLALVAPLLTPGVATTVKADNSSNGKVKISSDLKKRGGGNVNVIIKSVGDWSNALTGAVKDCGGSVTKSYKHFNLRAASLPPHAIEDLAERD